MSPTPTNRFASTISLAIIAGLGLTGVASQAQGVRQQAPTNTSRLKQLAQHPGDNPAPPLFLPGELVVRLAAGATPADAQTLASRLGAQVKRKLRFAPNTYVLQNVQGSLDQAVTALGNTVGVLRATKNQLFRPAALPPSDPNDSLFSQQWPLKVTGASNLYGITVGQRLVNGPKKQAVVALLDSGVQTSHPDLADNIDSANAWDFVLDQPYDESSANSFFLDPHATEVAGCIAPLTNNSQGIAGYPWEGVKILPCRVTDFIGSGTLSAIPVSAVTDALYYAIDKQVDVVNMSFGLIQSDPMVSQAVIDVNNQGILCVCSTGDGFFSSSTVEFPATMDEAFAVGATGPSGEAATYSNSGPEVDLAAPGGNDPNFNDVTREAVLTQPTDFIFGNFFGFPIGYGADQGTSFAAGYVSGAIATLITQGAGDGLTGPERVAALKDLLQSTARNPFGVQTPQLGAGVLNVDAAIRKITQYIDIVSPEPNEVTASTSETLVGRLVLPFPTIVDETFLQVFKNGQDVSADVEVTDPIGGFFQYTPAPDDAYLTGVNTLDVVAQNFDLDPNSARSLSGDAITDVGVNIPARAFLFRVSPRIEYPGLATFSIPYELDSNDDADTLNFLLGGNEGRLARWLPEQGRYAIYDPFNSPQEDEASLTTDNAGVVAPPVGVGFWRRIIAPELPPPPEGQPPQDPNSVQIRLQIRGTTERSPFYRIPLKPGFNLVGTPYNFRIPFNVVNVQVGNEIMSVAEAARRGFMKNVIWRYQDGHYTFQVLPSGQFIPWEAHWLQANTNLTLIIPRVGSGLGTQAQAAPAPKMASGAGATRWATTLRASAAGRTTGEVRLGRTLGKDPSTDRLQLPPAPQGMDDLRVADARLGRLAEDLRLGGDAQTWTVEYETSRPGQAVKLSWDAFPPSVLATVRVNGGKAVSGNLARSLTFTPQKAGVYRLQVAVKPLVGSGNAG